VGGDARERLGNKGLCFREAGNLPSRIRAKGIFTLALRCCARTCFPDPPFSLSAARFQLLLKNAFWTANLGTKSQISRIVFFSRKTLAAANPSGSVRAFSIYISRHSQVFLCQPSTNS
jgi:hypothetical protein